MDELRTQYLDAYQAWVNSNWQSERLDNLLGITAHKMSVRTSAWTEYVRLRNLYEHVLAEVTKR